MPFLTVADVLRLPVLVAGLPRVLAGQDQLARPVRWVHVTELLDPASFLEGGELVLTTGMPQHRDPASLRGYVDQLADVGAAGLVVELGRRYQKAPAELVSACRERDLPLIVLSRGVRFIEVTQTVHALILDAQGELLRRSQQVHEVFTALTLRRADPAELVATTAELAGRPVVLENLVHHAVLVATPSPDGQVLEAWPRRSRATPTPDRAGPSGPEEWLVVPLELDGQRWGRLVMLSDRSGPAPSPERSMILERAATSLTLARLTGDREWARTAQCDALRALIGWRYRSQTEARIRIESLGLPTVGHRLVAVVLGRCGPDPATPDSEIERKLVADLTATGVPALIGRLAPNRIGVLLALPRAAGWEPVVARIGRLLAEAADGQPLVAVGPPTMELRAVPSAFAEARRVADAIGPATPPRPFHMAADLGLPELLRALREDVRLQDYVERQLSRLIDHDQRHDTDLLGALRSYLAAAGNKSVAAKAVGLSRQAFYQRLRTIERLLVCDLESGPQRTQLHVAVLALDAMTGTEQVFPQ